MVVCVRSDGREAGVGASPGGGGGRGLTALAARHGSILAFVAKPEEQTKLSQPEERGPGVHWGPQRKRTRKVCLRLKMRSPVPAAVG